MRLLLQACPDPKRSIFFTTLNFTYMRMPSYIKLPEHNKRQYRETPALTVREDQHPLDPDKQSWKTNDFMR